MLNTRKRHNPSPLVFCSIIGGLFRNQHIVWVAFAQTSIGDTYKAGIILHICNCSCTSVAHRLAYATNQLVYQRTERTFVGNARFDPFSNQLRLILCLPLEVAIFAIAALLHCAYRPHTAVVFEALSLRDDELSGTLIYSRQEAPQHDCISTRSDGFSNITGVLNATISDDGHTMLASKLSTIINCCDLRHANAGDDTSCTDSARTYTYFDCVYPCLDKRFCSLRRNDIARDQLSLFPKAVLYLGHCFDDHA